MACPNGCINGAGQPPTNADGRAKRSKTLYKEDKMSVLKRSQDNPLMNEFYSGVLKGKVHELLHFLYSVGVFPTRLLNCRIKVTSVE